MLPVFFRYFKKKSGLFLPDFCDCVFGETLFDKLDRMGFARNIYCSEIGSFC